MLFYEDKSSILQMSAITFLITRTLMGFDASRCGGPDGTRTHGLRVANAALYQLSYEPVPTLYILASSEGFVKTLLTIFLK